MTTAPQSSDYHGPPLVVGIAGGSGSGKTWLADKAEGHFGDRAVRVSQDWYYRDLSHLPIEEAAKNNFDHPNAIEADFLNKQLRTLIDGSPIEAPDYDYSRYSRLKETQTIRPAPLIIVEGIHLLNYPDIMELIDYSVFIEVSSMTRLLRRIRRDLQQRGYQLSEILEMWDSRTRPMHQNYIQPSAAEADFVWKSLEDRAFVPDFLADLENRLAKKCRLRNQPQTSTSLNIGQRQPPPPEGPASKPEL